MNSHYGQSSAEARFLGIDPDTLNRTDDEDEMMECEFCGGSGIADLSDDEDCDECDGTGEMPV